MLKNQSKIFRIFIFIVLIFTLFFNFLVETIKSPQFFTYAGLDDINYLLNNNNNGLITYKIDNSKVFADDGVIKIDRKFLGLITLESAIINTKEETIYAGGNAVGVYLSTDGVILLGSNSIITKDGLVDTLVDSDLQVGDTILKLNGKTIKNLSDIRKIINEDDAKGKEVIVTYIRKNKEYTTTINPALDIESGEYRLGIWVKNDASGVGTLTFVKENGEFGALGHSINPSSSKEAYKISGGKVYNCNIIGVNKGKKGKAGELKGLFLQGKNAQGDIKENNSTGIYGDLNLNSKLFLEAKTREYKIGGRFTARPGKAKILSCIDGDKVEEFNIEIIKTNYQTSSKEKSMVIKVTDKALLEKTGGIVQGMSGSPIIQNGKLIGAVTHVFLNDSTKGFGLYLDWMI